MRCAVVRAIIANCDALRHACRLARAASLLTQIGPHLALLTQLGPDWGPNCGPLRARSRQPWSKVRKEQVRPCEAVPRMLVQSCGRWQMMECPEGRGRHEREDAQRVPGDAGQGSGGGRLSCRAQGAAEKAPVEEGQGWRGRLAGVRDICPGGVLVGPQAPRASRPSRAGARQATPGVGILRCLCGGHPWPSGLVSPAVPRPCRGEPEGALAQHAPYRPSYHVQVLRRGGRRSQGHPVWEDGLRLPEGHGVSRRPGNCGCGPSHEGLDQRGACRGHQEEKVPLPWGRARS